MRSPDPAEEIEALIAKRGARLDQEAIVLHLMQSSDGEETEPPVVRFGWGCGCGPGKHAINPKTLQDDFL